MEEQIKFLGEIKYKYVDGYKHRELLTEIGWEYTVEDGFYTSDSTVIDTTIVLEECLIYKYNGVTDLEDRLLAGIGDKELYTSYGYRDIFEHLIMEVDSIIRGFRPYRMDDVHRYVEVVSRLELGLPTDLISFARGRMDRLEDYFRGKF